MGCYLLCKDGVGRCMSVFVYIIMLLGNLVYILSIVRPAINTDGLNGALIDYFCYCVLWMLMVFSHVFTMCVDPGFIPHNYEYK